MFKHLLVTVASEALILVATAVIEPQFFRANLVVIAAGALAVLMAVAAYDWIRAKRVNVTGSSENRTGNFFDGENHGTVNQAYYDRLPPRSVSIGVTGAQAVGVAPQAIVRPAEQEHERFLFAESLAETLRGWGFGVTVQSGYAQAAAPFAGVVIHAAPNPVAEANAQLVADAISAQGYAVERGEAMAWGEDNRVLLLIGTNA